MTIILATRNESKTHQIREVLIPAGITVLSLGETGIEGEAVEDGVTLEDNAFKKVRFVSERLLDPSWVIADDTGLYIDALGGRPGIHAVRWAGEGLSPEQIMRYTLDQLQGIPEKECTATFVTVAAVRSPRGEEFSFKGSVKGVILKEPRTVCQPNMPYSPIFLTDGHSRVWAEMSVEEENAVSHRWIAFKQVRDFFLDLRSNREL